jgi:flagellar motility protein MotE (MotC chaperone)
VLSHVGAAAMSFSANRLVAIGAFVVAAAGAGHALAQNDAKQKPVAGATEKSADGGVARYCANVAPAAAEARIAWQEKRLLELDGQLKQRIADLEKKEAEAREWVSKREALLNTASDGVAAIYGKMEPEAAAAQLATMDDATAVSILSKLNARAASAVLDEMDADKAGKLTALLSGAAAAEKKS